MLPTAPPERLRLPTLPPPATRSSFPLVATLAPVVVSVVLWMLTQSVYSLLFAVLGPVVAVGGLIDGRVGRRRAARRERERFLAALERTADAISGVHDRERERLARLAPDAPPAGWGEGCDGPLPLRVGRGTLAESLVLDGDDPEDAAEAVVRAVHRVRHSAATLVDAPIVVDARDGIGITGPPVAAAALARALAVRLAARLSPADARLAAPADEPWADHLPHEVTPGEAGRFSWHVGLALDGGGDTIVIAWAAGEADLPGGCGILIATGGEATVAGIRIGEVYRDVRLDAVTAVDALARAHSLARSADARGLRPPGDLLPTRVTLRDLLAGSPDAAAGSLSTPVGRDADGPVIVDLVAHGPHAVIAGTTGSGKSELLVSWILGMAAARSPEEVAFLLVDFKGGSAFAPLAVLPHVLATLSDLDDRLTRRAIESLRAELLHRERVLAAAGARSIADLPRGVLPRLVIVVDEFAAVVSASPELHEVFGDLAARGRSLGLHLILCTQRPAGVIRDAVLANATLRLSLRVTDRGDSVAMLGSDAAARLPADPRGRGILLCDGEPRTLQLAIADAEDASRIATEAPRARVRRPWCEPLPGALDLDDLPPVEAGLPFGLVDLPTEQRQPTAAHVPERHGHLLVLGGSGAGSSTVLDTLVVSAVRAGMPVCVVPAEPADAWAVLARAAERSETTHSLLVIDDLDSLVARFDADYRHEFLELLTALARGGGPARHTLVVAAHRLTGPLSGIAGLFGSRLLLRQTSRDEHVLAGGDPRAFDPDLPPGAGVWRGDLVQVARAGETARPTVTAAVDTSGPTPVRVDPAEHPVLAIVAGRPRGHAERLRATGTRVIVLGTGATPAPDELQVTGAGVPTVLLGDPEAWLADWALLAAARRDWPIVLIDVGAADHRALLRDRALPPPLGPKPGECWLYIEGRTRRAILSVTEVTRESEEKHPRNR